MDALVYKARSRIAAQIPPLNKRDCPMWTQKKAIGRQPIWKPGSTKNRGSAAVQPSQIQRYAHLFQTIDQ